MNKISVDAALMELIALKQVLIDGPGTEIGTGDKQRANSASAFPV